jgi:Secretion system C-terminal sorting domain
VTLHEQGGGSTYIGGANDLDLDTPGECWHYCWAPNATNGTWVDNSVFGSNNTQLGGNPPNEALIPGTYESLQPFNSLIECPLNGTWTFRSTDLWGADNGALCGWEIHFDPSLGGDTTAFVPVYGAGCDSTFWSGGAMVWNDDGCDSILVSPSEVGVLELTYTATNNFGCTQDTVVSIQVLPPSDPYCLTLGLRSMDTEPIHVFPIPAGDQLTITGAATLSAFTLYDTGGRAVWKEQRPNTTTTVFINLHDLAPGHYVLELTGTTGYSRFPIIKQ